MQAARIESATVTTGGLTSRTTWSRTATLSDPANPLSLTQFTTTVTTNGRPSTVSFDATTRTLTETTPEGRQTIRTFDPLGRVLTAQTPGLAAAAFQYDARGRLFNTSAGSGAEARTVSYTYDTQGRLATVTDPLGQTASLEYDLAGRTVSTTLPGGRAIQGGYDANSNLVSLTPPGRPSHGFGYTVVNLPDRYTPPPSNPSGGTLYTFDQDRRPLSNTLPAGEMMHFAYDAAGRLDALTFDRGVLDLAYSGSTGNLVSRTAPGGETITLGYNQGLLTSWTSSGTVEGSVSWTHDNDFRTRTRSLNGGAPLALD